MASKQPFKLFNITQKLTTWGIRINKFFKHRVLSKRKNALLIGGDNTQFRKLLTTKLAKTWQVYHINQKNLVSQNIEIKEPKIQTKQKQLQNDKNQIQLNKQENSTQKRLENLSLLNYQLLEQQLKGRQYDAIIVLPQNKSSQEIFYPSLQDQSIATVFIPEFQRKIMKNIVAYRLANKFLTTSGSFILSCSQNDFLKGKQKQEEKSQKIQTKNAIQQKKQNQVIPSLSVSKNIIDNSICYLGIVVGDRDYTDLNSWTLVGLSQEVSSQDVQFCTQFYRDWADSQNLPMPGSFALFKRNHQNSKKCQYVQYL